jgi:hypothetical protein
MQLSRLRSTKIPTRVVIRPPTILVRHITTETPHSLGHPVDPLDKHIVQSILRLLPRSPVSVPTLYEQYRARSGWMRDDLILVSEERPSADRRIEFASEDSASVKEAEESGDGTVLVVHAILKTEHGMLLSHKISASDNHRDDIVEKLAVCSGFVLNTREVSATAAQQNQAQNDGSVILTCAHTLEEVSFILTMGEDY